MLPQLDFARDNGIEIKFGNPAEEDIPGTNVILPANVGLFHYEDEDLNRLRKGLIKKSAARANGKTPTAEDIAFLAADTNTDEEYVKNVLKELGLL